ncbi:hypothetical protein GCM10023108_07990 [Saccharopolyspora hordei]
MSSSIPTTVRNEVISEVYRRADDLDWPALTDQERSSLYDAWVKDPDIGGKLVGHIPASRMRVWLKDGPLKEFTRARWGLGPLAHLVSRRYPGPQELVQRILGTDWSVLNASIKIKPNRCTASNFTKRTTFLWGLSSSFDSMVTCALHAIADGQPDPLITVTIEQGRPVPKDEKAVQKKIAARIGVPLHHTTVRLRPVTPAL